ncbi:transposase [Rhodanobacter thiooxydans]|uniref:transposase n=1 Tax=Rhodanobacter thiooxydans TaxID=416169 RepID=UPI00308328F0
MPGIPQHIVQRGNNRLPCFLDDTDRHGYLHLLREALLDTHCALHGYALMDNHVHLLATPPEAGAIARLMQKLGRSYVGQFNARHRRTGTLWEGRYKACLFQKPGQSALSMRFRGQPIFAGPAQHPSCASMAARKRSVPSAC